MIAARSIFAPGLAALLFAWPAFAHADVKDAGPGGFTIEQKLDIAADRAKLWRTLIHPELWWSPDHTYSGDARKLRLDARAGGCWCESIKGGTVEHLRVVFVQKEQLLRLSGGLGPLQGMASGTLSLALESRGQAVDLTMTYRVWGYDPAGLDKLAPIVDQVLAEQMARLKSTAETGKPAT
jgi:hypothetical protein